MSEQATPTPTLPPQGGGETDVDAKLAAYEPVYQRMERMRKGLLKRFTKWELGWLLAEELLFQAMTHPSSLVEGIDREEARLIKRAKGLRKLSRIAGATRRLARIDARIDDLRNGKAASKRRRRKRKAVR